MNWNTFYPNLQLSILMQSRDYKLAYDHSQYDQTTKQIESLQKLFCIYKTKLKSTILMIYLMFSAYCTYMA
jgi:type III secretory pathway component EscU